MALRAAVASGNWSNPAIWNGGVLPGPNDIVASNTYNVTIDQDINVDTLTNTAQSKSTIIPFMTSNTAPSGIASSNVGVAWQAFDNSSSYWLVQPAQVGDYVQYQFPTPRAVDQYDFTNGTSFNGSVSLQASNDGVNFTTLHTASVVITPSGTYTSPSIGNSTPYLYYRFVLNSAIYVQITFVRMYEYLGLQPATAGGGFILNDGVTVTCTNATNGIAAGSVTCLTIAAVSPAIVNLNANVTSSVTSIVKSGNCTLNVTGLLQGNNNAALSLNNNTGTTNIVGEIRKSVGSISNTGILSTGTGNTINITGDLNYTGGLGGGNIKRVLTSSGSCNINITGNLVGSLMSANADFVLAAGTNDIINITGNVLGTAGFVGGTATITGGAFYLNVIGQIVAGSGGPAINNTNTSAIIILTGPFISHESGIQPLYVTRMFYRRTMGSYFEFRDNSTNGALPPAGAAPATRLVSPDTVVDAPIPANVRQGVVYASGSQTGTMIVPSPSNVTINVPVDNTVGTAILNADNLWAIDTSTMNTANSIGERLKNAATVQTVGDQLVSLL